MDICNYKMYKSNYNLDNINEKMYKSNYFMDKSNIYYGRIVKIKFL